MIDVYC